MECCRPRGHGPTRGHETAGSGGSESNGGAPWRARPHRSPPASHAPLPRSTGPTRAPIAPLSPIGTPAHLGTHYRTPSFAPTHLGNTNHTQLHTGRTENLLCVTAICAESAWRLAGGATRALSAPYPLPQSRRLSGLSGAPWRGALGRSQLAMSTPAPPPGGSFRPPSPTCHAHGRVSARP